MAIESGKVTHYAGAHFEAYLSGCPESTGTVQRSYYYAGAARIAMRVTYETVNEVDYILTDHLASTSKVVYFDQYGDLQVKGQQWYKPWGEVRQLTGELPTDRTFQGQRDNSYINMLWFGSRWYDPALGRFNQPDSIVPLELQGVQAWNRFAFANNNPLLSTHCTSLGTTCWVGGKDEPFELLSDANAIGEQFFR